MNQKKEWCELQITIYAGDGDLGARPVFQQGLRGYRVERAKGRDQVWIVVDGLRCGEAGRKDGKAV